MEGVNNSEGTIGLYRRNVITIREIAEMLDVSTTTVSNMINGKTKKVSKKKTVKKKTSKKNGSKKKSKKKS